MAWGHYNLGIGDRGSGIGDSRGIIRGVNTLKAEPSTAARAFSWTGGGVFVASLVYFLYSYLVVFGEPAKNAATLGSVAFDVTLFSAFALHHSIFAREGVRAWVTRTFRDLERSVYVWVASLLFAATCLLWRPVAGIAWDAPEPAAWALRGVQLLGLWLSTRSAGMIGALELAGIRDSGLGTRGSNNLNSIDDADPGSRIPDPEFKAAGPYSLVRHPIYLGWFLLVFAVPSMTMTQLVFAVVSGAYVLIAIPFEERSLRRTTDGAYDRYARQVRWKLLPHIY